MRGCSLNMNVQTSESFFGGVGGERGEWHK